MHGRVIGINTSIGESLLSNNHVPVNPYRENWDKIAQGEVWGGNLGSGFTKGGPYLGVQTVGKGDDCIIAAVLPQSPAEKAGLRADDVIRRFDGKDVPTPTALSKLVLQRKVGDRVVLDIQRGDESLSLRLEIGRRQ